MRCDHSALWFVINVEQELRRLRRMDQELLRDSSSEVMKLKLCGMIQAKTSHCQVGKSANKDLVIHRVKGRGQVKDCKVTVLWHSISIHLDRTKNITFFFFSLATFHFAVLLFYDHFLRSTLILMLAWNVVRCWDNSRIRIKVRTGRSQLLLQNCFTSHTAPCNCKWQVAYLCKSKHTNNHSRNVQLETIFWRASHPNWPVGTAFSTLNTSPQSPTEGFLKGCQKNLSKLFKSRSTKLARREFSLLAHGKGCRSPQAQRKLLGCYVAGLRTKILECLVTLNRVLGSKSSRL